MKTQRTIYYKQGRLNKSKTCLSLVKYHVMDVLRGRELRKLVVEQSDTSFDS